MKREIHHIDQISDKTKDNSSFTKDAAFYHDLLNYNFTINKSILDNIHFHLSDIQNWMVQDNNEIVNYYKDLSTRNVTKSIRVSYRKGRIKNKFEDLIKLNLIYVDGTKKAEKVNVDIPLFAYTKFGILLALIIKSMNLRKIISIERDQNKILNYEKESEKINQTIYELFDSILKIGEDYPYSYVFYKDLINKIKEKGLFGKLVNHIILVCNSNLSIRSMEQLFRKVMENLNQKSKILSFIKRNYQLKGNLKLRKTIFLGDMKDIGLCIGLTMKV